jgi:hypothetical protein
LKERGRKKRSKKKGGVKLKKKIPEKRPGLGCDYGTAGPGDWKQFRSKQDG